MYLYNKDLFESKYQLLINVRGKIGIKCLKNAFIDYSQTNDVYEGPEDYNSSKKRNVLIVLYK